MSHAHSRFWAQVETFRACCPRCQSFILAIPGQPKLNGLSHLRHYDRVRQRVRCPSCQTVYSVGLLFWPTTTGLQRIPIDVKPTKRELAELRNLAGGWWLRDPPPDPTDRSVRRRSIISTERSGLPDLGPAVNLYILEPCTCAPRPWSASCPVHGGERLGKEDTET